MFFVIWIDKVSSFHFSSIVELRFFFCGECFARGSATLQVVTPEWFLMALLFDGVLGKVDDALGVLGVDRVVPIVVRVLVSWCKEE